MSHGRRQRIAATTQFWANASSRRMVAATARSFSRIFSVHRLFHVGGVSSALQRKLRLLVQWRWSKLPLAIFFAGNFWNFAACMVRQTIMVAALADFFRRIFCFVGTGRISFHLLLLSRRIL